MEDREARIQRLLEDIDPTFRMTKLEEQLRQLNDRFLDSVANAESQAQLTERHRTAAEEADDKAKPLKQRFLEEAEEASRQTEDFLEFIVLQIESVREKIDDLKKAGTGKKAKITV